MSDEHSFFIVIGIDAIDGINERDLVRESYCDVNRFPCSHIHVCKAITDVARETISQVAGNDTEYIRDHEMPQLIRPCCSRVY